MKRQHLLLLLLLLLLAGAIGYSILASPRQERVAPAARAAQTQKPSAGVVQDSGIRLRTDLLDEAPRPFAGVKRDLFYGAEPVVAVAVKKVVAPPPPVVPVEPLPPPPPPPPTEQELMRIELGRFTFLGYLEKEGRRTIFLRAEGEPFVVKLGDRFGNKKQFLVVSLAPTRMEVRAGDDPQLYPIILVEQEALVPRLPAAGERPPDATPGAAQQPFPSAAPRPSRLGGRAGFGARTPIQASQPSETATPEETMFETTPPPEIPQPVENELPQPEGQNDGNEE